MARTRKSPLWKKFRNRLKPPRRMTQIWTDSNRQQNRQRGLVFLQTVLSPDLFDLALMFRADKIILHESERWSRKGRTHRARIRTPDGTDYLSVPILKSDRRRPICEVRIDQKQDRFTPLSRTIGFKYRKIGRASCRERDMITV